MIIFMCYVITMTVDVEQAGNGTIMQTLRQMHGTRGKQKITLPGNQHVDLVDK